MFKLIMYLHTYNVEPYILYLLKFNINRDNNYVSKWSKQCMYNYSGMTLCTTRNANHKCLDRLDFLANSTIILKNIYCN